MREMAHVPQFVVDGLLLAVLLLAVGIMLAIAKIIDLTGENTMLRLHLPRLRDARGHFKKLKEDEK